MARDKQTVRAADVATVKAADLIGPAPRPVTSVKVEHDLLEELTRRAEIEYRDQLQKQLKRLLGQHVSPDDTIRLKVAFEVTIEPRELETA